ncbi:type II secretion system protein [Candidatus Sumerlaeota bacterium]|nr:type II secretion system protein [Candidatus Sumerlaeota bacterium]
MNRHAALKSRNSFALLEVLVSVMILSIALSTLMRSFTISMNVVKRNDIITQGCILGEALLQDLEMNSPKSKNSSGTFEDDGFPLYSYEIAYDEEVPRYGNLPKGVRLEDPVPIRKVNVKIYYTAQNSKKTETVTSLDLILPPIERWQYESRFLNGLFMEDSIRSSGRRRR